MKLKELYTFDGEIVKNLGRFKIEKQSVKALGNLFSLFWERFKKESLIKKIIIPMK